MDYIVMCRVHGGVTGLRQAPLKQNGQVQYFASKAEAEAVAKDLNRPRPYNRATFHYWAEPALPAWARLDGGR